MQPKYKVLALSIPFALRAGGVGAKESIEFVAEHLAEIAMDNRYASLPLWNSCDDTRRADKSLCFGLNAGYARTHSGSLSIDGPMLSLSAARALGERLRLTGFLFFDDFSLKGGTERRPLDVLFVELPLAHPVEAVFAGLDGEGRDIGLGVALNGSADWGWLPSFEWSAGIMWQRFELSDYRFDYVIAEGPDTGATGIVDYSSTYMHISPVLGVAWPRARGVWQYAPHVQLAVPLPRRGIAGRISGPGFDLGGNTADNGTARPFGDPSITIGFDITYRPWHLTADIGSTITQALIEPRIHEGVQHNVILAVRWVFQ